MNEESVEDTLFDAQVASYGYSKLGLTKLLQYLVSRIGLTNSCKIWSERSEILV